MKKANNKKEVVTVLRTFARVLRVRRESAFRIKAFNNAAESINNFSDDLQGLHKKGALKSLPGIGVRIQSIINEIMLGKTTQDFFPDFPLEILAVAEIPFIGLKRALTLKAHGIITIEQLKIAAENGSLFSVPGFSKALVGKIKQGDFLADAVIQRFGQVRLDQALLLARKLMKNLEKKMNVKETLLVGDLRRGIEIIETIDILVIGKITLSQLKEILLKQGMVQIRSIRKPMGGVGGINRQGLGINVYRFPEKAKAVAQILLTGSKDFVENFLNIIGCSYAEFKKKKAASEEAIFREYGLQWIPPERRESGIRIASIKSKFQRLIQLKDLQGAFHNHTFASDGLNSLAEMQAAALRKGLCYISINDHSSSAYYANGQKKAKLVNQVREIASLNRSNLGKFCSVLTGTESDILADGSLDYDDDILNILDIVVASVHSQLKMDKDRMTQRMVNAALNPFTTIIGHPTGRLLLKRPPSIYDLERLFTTCKSNDVAVELNCQPARLDLNAHYLAAAKACGVWIAIDADAHSTRGFDFLDYGIMVARRAGLTPNDVLNTLSLKDLRSWLIFRKSQRS